MKVFLKSAVAIGLTLILGYWLFLRFPQLKENLAVRDSISYWAAGQLLVHRQNPYDHETVLRMEQGQGYKDQRPLVLRTPPWSLFMVAPLGLLGPFGAWVAWIFLSLICLFAAMRLGARMYGDAVPPNLLTLLGYTFAPVPACLVSGQMGLVLMIGVVLFLWWERERTFLAGAALVLPFAKPHLLSLFWLVFALWIIAQRKWRVAVGFALALAGGTVFALAFDPKVFMDYRQMLHAAAIGKEFIPALSGVLRLLFFRRFFWLQFAPMFLGLIWAVRYFLKNRFEWDWRQHGPALLVVSVLVTPYEWLSDETVLLPAILQAVALVYACRESLKIRSKIAMAVFASLDVLLLLILKSKVPFSTGIYFWSSLVWFLWYFRARKWHAKSQSTSLEAGVVTQSAS